MQIKEISKRHVVFMDETVFKGMFVNMHLIVGESRNYLIDTGLGSESVEYVKQYLKDTDNDNKVVIINSHDHWDHVWGNGFIETDMILSHQKTYDALRLTWDQQYDNNKQHQKGDVVKKLPNMLFEDSFVFMDDGIELGYAPAHSDNDIYVYDHKERVLNIIDNMGDTDEDIIPGLQLGEDALLKAIEVYCSYPVDYVVSGHNDIRDMKTIHKMKRIIEG